MVLVNGDHLEFVHALDRGLNYGDGVFRTLKIVAGQVRWWSDQYGKLAEDCAALGLQCPDKALLEREVGQVAAEPGIGVIKVVVTRGAGQRGYAIPADAASTRIVMGFPSSGRENLDVRIRWCELRLAMQPRLAGIKHLNRLENVLARSEWRDPEIAEGLLRDQAGHVICGTMTNLFIVEQGGMITPDLLHCGIAGVTRSRIMRAAERHGQTVGVEPISSERLLSADEVLLCNSLVDVWRVAEMDDRRWPDSGWAEKLRIWLDEEDN